MMDRVRLARFEPQRTDGNTLVGVAVPFGETTRIDDPWEGRFDEEFVRGAFTRSLARSTPKLQFDHGTHPMIGSIPIGSFEEVTEVEEGLRVRAPLLDNWLVEPVRDAIRAGAITGMSIRFRPVAIETVADGVERGVQLHRVTEAELIELGPVVYPAYRGTSVAVRRRAA